MPSSRTIPHHLSWVEIDRMALRHNYREALRLARRSSAPLLHRPLDLLAVVKADAYGHGMIEAARAFMAGGCSLLAVSNLEEALALRRAAPEVRILMLETALPALAPALVANNITPVVCSLDMVRALDRAARRAGKMIPLHVEVDTGMGRLGVWHADLPAFVAGVMRCRQVVLEGLMTHFPLADTDRAFTKQQSALFSETVCDLVRQGMSFRYLHAANSMGLSAYSGCGFDLARPGIMLYGLYPSPALRRRVTLRPVMSVKARVLLVKIIHKGRGISYGHTFRTRRDVPVAVIPIGYSDGYRRAFSNTAHVLINGKPCPVLGRVTMDQTIVDISLAGHVRAGDEVVVAGRQGGNAVTLDDLARWAGTIHYEIACNLGNRLPRVYRG